MPTLTFTEAEFKEAHRSWGCNCGPTALAFALQTTLEAARYAIPQFAERRYTSPRMMREALDFLGRSFQHVGRPGVPHMCTPAMALVRVQWGGRWMQVGVPTVARYFHTHWIAAWSERGVPFVFDCNGGIRTIGSWEQEIVPLLTCDMRGADGTWLPTHVWRIDP